jgi:predicted metal-binding membrane protein
VSSVALGRASWRHPELAAAGVAAGAWALLVAHSLQPHPWPEPYVAALSGWVVMAAAMMVPGALADVRRVALASMWHRRQRTIAIFLGPYLCAWIAFGVVALAFTGGTGLGGGGAAVPATLLGLDPPRGRAVRRCHLVESLPPLGLQADAACGRAGLRYGWRCIVACWPLMLAMAAAGHQALALMALLTAIVAAEKILLRSARLRAPAAALLAGAALVALA